jgi:hypothetical protein
MSRATLALAQELIVLDTEVFADRVSSVLILTAPYVFSACWAIMTPFMSRATLSKVDMISSDKAGHAAHGRG